jgi:hypothetical protein
MRLTNVQSRALRDHQNQASLSYGFGMYQSLRAHLPEPGLSIRQLVLYSGLPTLSKYAQLSCPRTRFGILLTVRNDLLCGTPSCL